MQRQPKSPHKKNLRFSLYHLIQSLKYNKNAKST